MATDRVLSLSDYYSVPIHTPHLMERKVWLRIYAHTDSQTLYKTCVLWEKGTNMHILVIQ